MNRLYTSPFRVYLLLGALAIAGIICGFNLPISLFPNSSKPNISVNISYGKLSAEEFLNSYGRTLETQLKGISSDIVQIDTIRAQYGRSNVSYNVEFKWGSPPTESLKEVQIIVNSFAARFPTEIRNSIGIWPNMRNSGFFALSFFSETRSLEDLYDTVEPVLMPRMADIQDAQSPGLYNPDNREVRIELIPEALAAFKVLPQNVDDAVAAALSGTTGGVLSTKTGDTLEIKLPREVQAITDLGRVLIPSPSGRKVHLSEIARVDFAMSSQDVNLIRTNGTPSLILWARPKPGANVKRMSEEMLETVKAVMPALPKDIQYRVLVDPSEFIRASITNVFHEVMIAAFLAVVVLFVFIGSFKNIVTAAIEIPISMVLAFILMKLFNMNLNLISLGGLALSAGMNVDASVVVMENIFRHFERSPGSHDFETRVRIVTEAVREVWLPIVASTISSIVVFLPLTFTSALSYAILGDLAKAVVFSHGFSAIVALILVPTIRLHLMRKESFRHPESRFEPYIKKLEEKYASSLTKFLSSPYLQKLSFIGVVVLFFALFLLIVPRLQREIVGKPDTDWMTIYVETQGNSTVQQMEPTASELEDKILKKYGEKVSYTFTQINEPNGAEVMVRLKTKHDMKQLWKNLEKDFVNTPQNRYFISPWNPSELPIPDPPQVQIAVRGPDSKKRAEVARDLRNLIEENKFFPRVSTDPNSEIRHLVQIYPHYDKWASFRDQNVSFSPSDVSDLLRITTQGRKIGDFPYKDRLLDVVLKMQSSGLDMIEDVSSFPIQVGQKLVALRALADVRDEIAPPNIFRKDQRELFFVEARHQHGEEHLDDEAIRKTNAAVEQFKTQHKAALAKSGISVSLERADKDLTDAIYQLTIATILSIGLILITLLLQLGSFAESFIVLVSIPLGMIGVITSLFIFGSTLSLNSILGVILLNGIAVANSIILVDFTKRLYEEGLDPKHAVLSAAKARLRPILITSLTTVLGMLPIALGTGEGGSVLQPLGIAVSGGLWISMCMTLFLVPALHLRHLTNEKEERSYYHRVLPLFSWIRFGKTLWLAALFVGASTTLAAPLAPEAFESAVKTILDRHPAITAQKGTRESTRGRNLPNKLTLLPNLSLEGSHEITGSSTSGLHRTGAQAVANVNLFKFGGDFATMKAASRENEAEDWAVSDSMLKAEFEAVSNLVNAIQAKKEVEVLERMVAARRESLKVSKARYEKGILALQESKKTEVDLQNTLSRLADAETKYQTSLASLKTLLGETDFAPEWAWDEAIEGKVPTFSVQRINERPDIMASKNRLEAAESRTTQARANLLPKLDANGSYGYFKDDAMAPGSDYQPSWRVSLNLKIPLFDKGANNIGGLQAASGTELTAGANLEILKRKATAEWKSADVTFKQSVRNLKMRNDAVQTSRGLYRDNLSRFQKGLIDANELILDQNRLYESELSAIQGFANLHTSVAQYCQASGSSIFSCWKRGAEKKESELPPPPQASVPPTQPQ